MFRLAGLAALFVCACFIAPPPAAGHSGDGRYRLPALPRSAGSLLDIAPLADGSVVATANTSDLADGNAWHLREGANRWRSIPRFRATGITGTADGALLGLDAYAHRVVSWRPGQTPVVVAGTGEGEAFGGDGGLATQASLHLEFGDPGTSRGIAALPAGGFLFADTRNNRIRAVDEAGIIRTVAGGGRRHIGSTNRQLAAEIRLTAPNALAALPRNGYVFLEARPGDAWGERRWVRRVSPRGVVTTPDESSFDGGDLVALNDGSVLGLGVGPPRWVSKPSAVDFPSFTERDVAGRSADYVEGGGSDGTGLWLAGGVEAWWLPGATTPARRAVAIRDIRVTRRGVRVVAQASAAGRLTLSVSRKNRVLRDTRTFAARRGHVAFKRPGRLRRGKHRLDVGLNHGWSDSVEIWGGNRLTRRDGRRLLGPFAFQQAEGTTTRLGRRCRSFGPRRVDCEVRYFDDAARPEAIIEECYEIATVSLPRTGVLRFRSYPCGHRQRPVFRAHPKWKSN